MLRIVLGCSSNKFGLCHVHHLRLRAARLSTISNSVTIDRFIQCSSSCINDISDITVIDNFITEEEESSLMKEIDKTWRHTKYEYTHWDDAIIGFRETEKSTWQRPLNSTIMERLVNETITSIKERTLQPLPSIHILDLAPDGYIRPHIDSVKFCGDVIAGISLLSASVMKLSCNNNNIMILLPQRSLYIMRNAIRYDYAHEILSNSDSYFNNEYIPRERRVSMICRTKPHPQKTVNV